MINMTNSQNTTKKKNLVKIIMLMAFSTLAIFMAVLSVIEHYSPVLYMDQWGFFDVSYMYKNLFSQHNEHRILIPRLLFIIDSYFFNARSVFLISLTLICQLIHVFLFWWIIGFSNIITTNNRIYFTLMASILFFSLTQYDNFYVGFQIQFVGVFAAATAAFACIGKSARLDKTRLLKNKYEGDLH